jgi:mono/diheme cytochrome c family protein
MHNRSKTFAALLLVVLFSPVASPQQSKIGKLTGDAQRGHRLFQRFCIGCHGPAGNGEGENAPYLDPKPRDFTLGLFKCRSTPSGSIPTDSDLFNTISRGVHGTFMPSWNALTPRQRADLIAYVKTFSHRFHDEQPADSIVITPEPPLTPSALAQGQDLYKQLGCVECHGPDGKGDGPSAATLVDAKDRPIQPYDFTLSSHFKCGSTDADVYRSLMTGLDGTPMPSYAVWLKPEQAWDLVRYIRSLEKRRTHPAAVLEAASKPSTEGGPVAKSNHP